MKKAYPFLLSLFIALCLLPAAAFAQEVTINKINYSIDETSGTASVVSGNQTNGRIEIPDTITVEEGKEYPVTVIGANAFDRYHTQKPRAYQEIIIGANVTTIESYAFSDTMDYIQKIQFNGDKCQTIASTAFDWMLFSKNPPFQLIVCGPQGCMDEVLKGVVDLKDKEILYQDPNAGEITKALQEQINYAQAGTETAITINKDYALTETLTVPAGKIIVLKDNGEQHTLSQAPVNDPGEMFKVEKGASLTFDGDLIFKGGETKKYAPSPDSAQGNIVNVSGEFTLKQGKLHGGKISANLGAAVLVNNGAKFTMTGGSIEAFTITSQVLSAPVVVSPNGYFDMSGGRISDNKVKVNASGSPNCSGGVLLWTWQPNDLPAKMDLSGEAVIDGNSAPQGGGIYLIGKTELNMSGGVISNNEATRGYGGGVCVAGQSGGNKEGVDVTSFTMTGGVIKGNSAAKSGGGIYVNSDNVTLSGGKIINNKAREWGGGVYVSEQPHTLRLTNVVIKQNEAKVMGGGIWICPTGSLEVHITNGGAIFDNATDPTDSKGAGADIGFVGSTSENRKLEISRRMLGGGRNVFYKDGGIIPDHTLGSVTAGQVDKDVPRFDPNNPGEEVVGFTTPAGCALISKPSEGAKQLANEAAKLIISGNKASQGGGIGSNGGVVIGNEGEYSLKVNKAWAEDIPESSRCAVTIKLKIKGIALDGDTVVLDKGNNWSAEFTGLPQPPQLIDCTVIEDPLPAGFAPEVSEAVFNETDKSYTITVTNKKAPAPTPTPTPGGGYEPTPTPFIIVPPKTGDGGFFRMLLSFLGFGK